MLVRVNGTAGANGSITEESRRQLQNYMAQWHVPRQLIDELAEHHTLVTYSKGASLFAHGSPADPIFWVLSGVVKLYCPHPGSGRILVRLAGPGEIIGQEDFIDAKGWRVRAFEAEALRKSSVALFSREHLGKLLRKLDEDTLIGMVEGVNTAWSSLAMRHFKFLGLSFNQRLEVVLADLAAKLGVKDARGVLLVPELSHADLAEMIGSSRPMVSRLIENMTAKRTLTRCGKHYILLGNGWNDAIKTSNVGVVPRHGVSNVIVTATPASRAFAS